MALVKGPWGQDGSPLAGEWLHERPGSRWHQHSQDREARQDPHPPPWGSTSRQWPRRTPWVPKAGRKTDSTVRLARMSVGLGELQPKDGLAVACLCPWGITWPL